MELGLGGRGEKVASWIPPVGMLPQWSSALVAEVRALRFTWASTHVMPQWSSALVAEVSGPAMYRS